MNHMKRSLALLAAIAIVAAAFALTVAPVVRAQDPSPQTVGGYATYLLYSGNGITATVNGTGKVTADYGVADCYTIVDETDVQTVTIALQSSPDNTNWNTTYTYADVTADGVAFTRTVLYGYYTRAGITLGGANPVTVTVRGTAKAN